MGQKHARNCIIIDTRPWHCFLCTFVTFAGDPKDRDFGLAAYFLTTFNASIDFLMSLNLVHAAAMHVDDTGGCTCNTSHPHVCSQDGDEDVPFDQRQISDMAARF
jgi:hypothetical protein